MTWTNGLPFVSVATLSNASSPPPAFILFSPTPTLFHSSLIPLSICVSNRQETKNCYFRSKNLNQKSIAGEYVVEKENRALKKGVYRRESGRKSPSPLIYSKPSYSCSQRRLARRDSRALRFLSSFAILSDFSSCCSRSSSRRAIRSAIRSSSSMSSMPASMSDDPSDA